MRYRLMVSAQSFIRIIPRHLRWWVAGMITQLVYWFWTEKRIATQKNMGIVLGLPWRDAHAQRIARLSWFNYGRYVADLLDIPNHSAEYHMHTFNPDDVAAVIVALDAAADLHKGVLVISGHYGNYDVAGVLGAWHRPIYGLAEKLGDDQMDRLLQGQRQALGITIMTIEESLRPFLRALREGEIVATPIDRPATPDTGIPITFFGHTTYIPRGLGAIAVKTQTTVLPIYAWYDGSEYRAKAFPTASFSPTGDERADSIRATQFMFESLEEMTRLIPEQWYMFRQFWPDDPNDLDEIVPIPARKRETANIGKGSTNS